MMKVSWAVMLRVKPFLNALARTVVEPIQMDGLADTAGPRSRNASVQGVTNLRVRLGLRQYVTSIGFGIIARGQ